MFALVCAVLGSARTASAGPGDATRLDYARSEHAARCPDADVLKAAVAKRLGYDLFFPAARQTISVEITDDKSGALHARMRLVNDQGIIVGSRELSEPSGNCDELVASLALAISIALDPTAALGGERDAAEAAEVIAAPDAAPAEPEPDQPESPEKVVKNARPRVKQPPRLVAPATASGPPVTLRASGFGAWGVAPAVGFGGRVGLGLRFEHFAFVLEGSEQLTSSRKIDFGSVEASLLAGNLAGCANLDWLAGCGLLRLGSLRTAGREIQDPHAERSLYFSAGLRAEATPALTDRVHLIAGIDWEKTLTPVTLRLYGIDQWKSPLFSLSASLGLELRFR